MLKFKAHSLLLSALVLSASFVNSAQAADYKVDAAHSKVGFTVRHLMITDVTGSFKDFEGSFSFDAAKGTVGATNFVVQAKSIDTDNEKRDEHLRSPDFFDVAKFPTVTMTNSKVTKAGKNKFKWTGDLTMHGVTKPVTLDLVYNGSMKDAWGNNRAGFAATGKIKRSDYGLTWNKVLESGGVTVSDEVRLNFDISAIETPAEAKPQASAK
jgi:polyisoprenoid-binding protein YceI